MKLTPEAWREHYRERIPLVFDVTAELYYQRWGEYFHLAVFEEGDDPGEFDAVLERTHRRYFEAIRGAGAGRILELATGGGAFAEWMADRTAGEVLGIDISGAQLRHARRRLRGRRRRNLRFLGWDIMRVAELEEDPFDAAVCLDAACYLPDRPLALAGIATRLRPGARLLLVDWCRSERPTGLQEELILEPLRRYWEIPDLETVGGYQRAFPAAGYRVLEAMDLSERVRPNWERGYLAAQSALADALMPAQLLQVTSAALRHGGEGVRLLKDQFYAALFAKVAADAGLLRYVFFLVERQ